MRFTKMHGIGNDYIYINAFEERVDDPAALAVKIADRHFGVGGDGLILLLPPEQGVEADVRMRMFNADGSEAEMCGNGIRCLCKLAHDHSVNRSNPMRVQTGRGVLTLSYTCGKDGKVEQVTVDMGLPILEAAKIPVAVAGLGGQSRVINVDLRPLLNDHAALQGQWTGNAGLDEHFTAVSMGNPHIVIYVRDVTKVPLEAAGSALETDHRFPRRINVHFVQVHGPEEVTMRTWERGSGITLACGTGASAVCVAGVLTGRHGRRILAHLPGGDLQLEWRESDQHVLKTGPAVEVFRGEWA